VELFLPPGERRRLPALLAAVATPLLLLVAFMLVLPLILRPAGCSAAALTATSNPPRGNALGQAASRQPMPTLRSARRRAGEAA
jgi:hypothetical protein